MTDNSNMDEEDNKAKPFFPDLAEMDQPGEARDLEAVFDVSVNVSAVLGHTKIPINQLVKLHHGDILPLDKRVGETLDIFVNNRLVARGEVVVVQGYLGIIMTEIIKMEA